MTHQQLRSHVDWATVKVSSNRLEKQGIKRVTPGLFELMQFTPSLKIDIKIVYRKIFIRGPFPSLDAKNADFSSKFPKKIEPLIKAHPDIEKK